MLNRFGIQSRLSKLIAEAFAAEGLKVENLRVDAEFGGDFKIALRLKPEVLPERVLEQNAAMARALGLPDDFVGKTLRVNRKLLKVTGYNPGAPKNAVNLVCVDTGKGYKCSAEYARLCPVIS